jgi:hypothetical protein
LKAAAATPEAAGSTKGKDSTAVTADKIVAVVEKNK